MSKLSVNEMSVNGAGVYFYRQRNHSPVVKMYTCALESDYADISCQMLVVEGWKRFKKLSKAAESEWRSSQGPCSIRS